MPEIDLSGITNGITNIIDTIANIPSAIFDWFAQVFNLIGVFFIKGLYFIWMKIAQIVDCIQVLFNMFVGIVPLSYKSSAAFGDSGNFIIDIFMHPMIYQTFIKVLILSVFLMIIFIFIAIIRNEYSTKITEASNGKWDIIRGACKGLFSFLFIPVVCFFGVMASGYVLMAVDKATSPTGGTIISGKLFAVSAYNANRARVDEDFFRAMNGESIGGYNINNFKDVFGGNKYKDQEAMAEAIDDAFENYLEFDVNAISTTDKFANYNGSNVLTGQSDNNLKNTSRLTIHNDSWVFYFYDLFKFDWIVGFFSIAYIATLFIKITLGAVVRLYDLALLFIVSPFLIAMMPLDNGGAFGKWKGEFVGKVLMIYAPIVAMNLYFILVNVFLQVDVSGTLTTAINTGMNNAGNNGMVVATLVVGTLGVYVLLNIFDLFIVLAGAQCCDKAIGMFNGFIGAQDMVSSGEGMMKKITDFNGKNPIMKAGMNMGKNIQKNATKKITGKMDEHHNAKLNADSIAGVSAVADEGIENAYKDSERKSAQYAQMADNAIEMENQKYAEQIGKLDKEEQVYNFKESTAYNDGKVLRGDNYTEMEKKVALADTNLDKSERFDSTFNAKIKESLNNGMDLDSAIEKFAQDYSAKTGLDKNNVSAFARTQKFNEEKNAIDDKRNNAKLEHNNRIDAVNQFKKQKRIEAHNEFIENKNQINAARKAQIAKFKTGKADDDAKNVAKQGIELLQHKNRETKAKLERLEKRVRRTERLDKIGNVFKDSDKQKNSKTNDSNSPNGSAT